MGEYKGLSLLGTIFNKFSCYDYQAVYCEEYFLYSEYILSSKQVFWYIQENWIFAEPTKLTELIRS